MQLQSRLAVIEESNGYLKAYAWVNAVLYLRTRRLELVQPPCSILDLAQYAFLGAIPKATVCSSDPQGPMSLVKD